MFNFTRIPIMALNSFPYPIPNLMISIIPFKDDPKTLTQLQASFLPFPWLTIPIASSSLYAISSTLDPLKFLLACLALTLFTFLRASSLKATLVEEEEFEEEAISEEEKNTDDDSCDDDSLLSESVGEASASEETDECSDGSISDEEGLIELDPKKPFLMQTSCGLQHKPWSDCYYAMEPFQRQALMDLLAEIYEEENMIEIDIAIGSIKCPRFEIEA